MKKIIILTVLIPVFSSLAGDLTVDNLTVSNDAAIHGKLDFYTIAVTNSGTNGVTATGGTITANGNYLIHTFTNNGTFQVSGGSLTCDVLVVAGGGGSSKYISGGGGAGGLIYTSNYTVAVGEYNVVVGVGGAGGVGYVEGGNGTNSVFGSLTAIGGGGGGKYNSHAGGKDGGSGGGSAADEDISQDGGEGTPGQGHNGGKNGAPGTGTGGGGGGAGTVGSNAVGTVAGNGGDGLEYSQFASVGGSPAGWFAGGGGGGRNQAGGTAGTGGKGGGANGTLSDCLNGVANTGGGAGGGALDVTSSSGGSGIVIVRYSISQNSSSNVTTLTISSNGINQAGASGSNVFMGKVGIGTNNPAEKLHVAGNVQMDGTNIVSAIVLGGETRTNWPNVAVGALIASNNLSDVVDKAAARNNLGLGSAATNDYGVFLTSTSDGSQLTNITAAQVGALSATAGALIAVNNLSDVANAGTARNNLGLGSAATNNTSAFLSTTGGEVNGDISLVAPSGDIPMGVYTNQ